MGKGIEENNNRKMAKGHRKKEENKKGGGNIEEQLSNISKQLSIISKQNSQTAIYSSSNPYGPTIRLTTYKNFLAKPDKHACLQCSA